mgnify:FL=1
MWALLQVKKIFKVGYRTGNCNKRKSLDVVIPTISKDFETLSLLIKSLKYLENQVNNIYIVSPDNNEIINFCRKNKIIFIDELSVLGFGKDKIKYKVNGLDRRGWIFQQLLKLSGESFTELKDYLVVDSDTIFVDYNCFMVEDGRYVYFASDEWHQPYFDAFKKIFGYEAPTSLSLTSHMMIFNHDKLREMKLELEAKHNKKWHDVYISTISPNEQSCISDYDTYANWMLYNYPDDIKILPFYNKSISRSRLNYLFDPTQKFSNLKSVSFHSYIER